MFGVLSFDATREEREWPEPLKGRLQLIAQVFANALARKQADEALRESEKRLSMAADSANAGLWTLETESGHIWGSEKTFQLLGIPWNKDFLIGEFLSLVHGSLHWKRVLNVMPNPTPEQIRAQARRAAGIFVRAYAPL